MAVVGEFAAARRRVRAETDQIRYCGELFTLADEVGAAPLMDYAEAAMSDVETSTLAGLNAMKSLLRDCFPSHEWARFWDLTIAEKVDAETLSLVCARVYEVISSRPTESPSGSSDGQSSISPSSSAWSTRTASLGLVPVDSAALTG